MASDPPSPQPHDHLFHHAFERPEVVAGELRAVLPPAIVAAIDFATLTLEPQVLVDRANAEIRSDFLYRVQIAGREAFVFILLEHQSDVHEAMPLKSARYMWRHWERWLRGGGKETQVPLIIPLVLHNGERPWRGPRRFAELYDAPVELIDSLRPHVLDFELRLDDLPALAPQALRTRQELPAFGQLVLFALQRARTSPDLVNELAEWLDLVAELVQTERGMEDWLLVLGYIESQTDFDLLELNRLIRERLGQPVEERMTTVAERLRAEGEAKGEARGQAIGEARGQAIGEARGRADTLLKLLRIRFNTEPDPAIVAAIRSGTIEQLERWTERVLLVDRAADLIEK